VQTAVAGSSTAVLLVEDDPVIALDTSMTLKALGLTQVEIAATLEEAFAALERVTPHLVVMDIDLRGIMSFGLAEHLARQKIPFVFTTGYGEELPLPAEFLGRPVVGKPYDLEELRVALAPYLQTASPTMPEDRSF
jgi:CheY-like chemotaxis protein